MEGLDPAALRRFDLKLLFEALTLEQRERVFAQEALGDADAPVPETSARLLREMDGLTLGDIANVCRQQRVLGETLAPEQFLRRLRAEWELK
jgi:SpoVK/Ycf46/Vps4 family AAA+-type ATPase